VTVPEPERTPNPGVMYSVMTFVQIASVASAAPPASARAALDAQIIVATAMAAAPAPARLIRADVVDVKRMCVLLGWWCDRHAI
jgi:hypothetical protein